jgi:hypothetical protein
MKRLLLLTVIGLLWGSLAGCRFMECLFRGPACQQPAPAATCGNPCTTYNPCDPCAGATVVTPGPEAYVPAAR